MQVDVPVGVSTADASHETVADRVRALRDSLSPAETKITRVLLAHYPSAGLQSSQTFAKQVGVSAPTVLRFLARLGFTRYADFQDALRHELEARRASPLSQSSTYAAEGGTPELFQRAESIAVDAIRRSLAGLSPAEFDAAVALLIDPKRTITLTGGRFSYVFADYLHKHLRLVRGGTAMLSTDRSDVASYLADQGKKDVLVAIDVRRYQRATVDLVAASRRNGAKVILLTDPWLSPATENADVVLSTRVEGVTVFDSLAPLTLVMEMLASAVQLALGESAERRMAMLDAVQEEGLLA